MNYDDIVGNEGFFRKLKNQSIDELQQHKQLIEMLIKCCNALSKEVFLNNYEDIRVKLEKDDLNIQREYNYRKTLEFIEDELKTREVFSN